MADGGKSGIDALLHRFQPIYNRSIRPYLPRTTRTYNEVEVKDRALLDRTPAYPDFEAESIRQLTDAVRPGDDVVIVGGGRGVTAVHAVRSGASDVRVYEAGSEQVELTRDTANRNGVAQEVSVEHAIVGEEIDAWGDTNGARRMAPSDLDSCDVLELDCEGTEVEILESLGPRPRTIIVECHPDWGAPESAVRAALPEGYHIAVAQRDEYDGLPLLRAELKDD